MDLSQRHRRFLIVEQGAIPSAFNLVINGGIAWALFHSATGIPLWGESSVGVDLLATAFLLPFLTCLIVSALVGRDVRAGRVPPLTAEQRSGSHWVDRPASVRGLFLGALGVLFGALPLVWALHLGQAQPLPALSFVAFKAVWAAMLAFLVTPVIGWWALASASRAGGV
jgi:hypothetical protein